MQKRCDRCGEIIASKTHYRYPHVFPDAEHSNSCIYAIFSKMLIFCEKCIVIFDKLDAEMRLKHHMKDNETLIKFYKQYIKGGNNVKRHNC